MYNDYYLQQIDNKCQQIISNQTILHNDLETINTNHAILNETIKQASASITAAILLFIIYKFIERVLR